MMSSRIIFLVIWIILTICIMTAFSLSKGELRGMSWKLRLNLSAFMSLFITTILLSALLDIST